MKRRDPHQWVKERQRDVFFVKAKKEGYRARSAYKLIELQQKFQLIGANANVLDLGAAPGAWLQVARKITNAHVDGIDLLPIKSLENVRTLQADIFDSASEEFIGDRKYDVILSDIAPNSSGHHAHDHLTLINILHRVLELGTKHLLPGGKMCVKVFDGAQMATLIEEWKKHFSQVKRMKPKSSMLDNSEFYLVGLFLKTR